VPNDGTIVTTNSVVEHADRLTVRFADDPNSHEARVLGVDPPTNLDCPRTVRRLRNMVEAGYLVCRPRVSVTCCGFKKSTVSQPIRNHRVAAACCPTPGKLSLARHAERAFPPFCRLRLTAKRIDPRLPRELKSWAITFGRKESNSDCCSAKLRPCSERIRSQSTHGS
jgi:hypothetical protein